MGEVKKKMNGRKTRSSKKGCFQENANTLIIILFLQMAMLNASILCLPTTIIKKTGVG